MKRVALATVILSAIALTAAAQPVRLSGRVLSDETGDPLPNARVTLSPAVPGNPVALTDRDGRFTLMAKPPVTVTARKSSYTHQEVPVTSGNTALEFRLPRAAIVGGHVVDERGDPVAGARVVVKSAPPGTSPKARPLLSANPTDDRGEYRIGSLPPGPVVVSLMTRGDVIRRETGPNQIAMMPSMRETFYPGTLSEDQAETIRLQSGDERLAIDFVVPAGQTGDTFPLMMSPLENVTDPRWTGAIRGRVVSTGGRPIPHAQVRSISGFIVHSPSSSDTTGRSFGPVTVTADGDGRFVFAGLPAGPFRLVGSKSGYSPPGLGATELAGERTAVRVNLADGEVREGVDVTLAPWGSLNGRIVDELGEPVQGAAVQLLQVRYQGGRRRLVGAGGAARLTDDLGRYRSFGLAPGKYIVSATVGEVGGAELPGYTRSYFPGGENAANAQFVSIDVGQQISGVDFALTRARTAIVSGRLLDSAGEPTMGGAVRLIPSQSSNAVTSLPANARLDRDGHFEFPNVTPGQYVIQVDRGRRGSSTEGEFGALPVAVDGVDVTGLVVQMSAGSSISGRVTFEAFQGTKEPRRGQIEITPVPIDADQSTASPANADIHEDWTFVMAGINGPRRLQLQQAPPGWTLKAIRARGIDVTDRPLPFGRRDQSLNDVEVVLTDRLSGVGGTIVDDRARPAAGAHVIVFPIDRARWFPASRYLRTAVAADEGAIALAGLPPGSYYAAAVAQLPADGSDAWQDPAYLESLVQRAASFALGEGQKQVVNLKLPDR